MASITWSGNYGGVSAGTSGLTTTITASSALPSNAVVTSVKYSISLTATRYSSSKQWKLYWLIAKNSAGTIGASIGSSGSSDVVNSASLSSASVTLTGYLTLSDQSVFQSTSIQCFAKANNNMSGSTSYMRAVSVTVEYSIPSLSWSTNLTASQVNDQVKLTWDSSPTYSGGTGPCQLAIHNGTAWIAGELSTSLRSYTLTPTAYGTSIRYKVGAWYSGITIEKSVDFTSSAPTLTWNNAAPAVTENGDGTLTIVWNKATGSWGASGSAVSYKLYVATSSAGEGTLVGTYTSNSATIDAPSKDSYYYVVVTYSTKSSTSGRTYYAAHRTVKRWNGSSWDECIAYYYNGSSWLECIPYRYNGTGWDLLSH